MLEVQPIIFLQDLFYSSLDLNTKQYKNIKKKIREFMFQIPQIIVLTMVSKKWKY